MFIIDFNDFYLSDDIVLHIINVYNFIYKGINIDMIIISTFNFFIFIKKM
jgi:hypothetical protein